MADGGKLYPGFGADFPAKMARLCKGADWILPNLTEAAFLLGREPVLEGYEHAFIEDTIAGLHALGVKNVVLTGVSFDPAQLGTAVSNGASIRYDFNPRLARSSHGTGDVFASVFAGAILRGLDGLAAAALAADIVCASIEATDPGHWYGVAFERAIPLLANRLAQ
jgi:pyridoxine kinase